MKRLWLILLLAAPAMAQTVINCGIGTPNPWVMGGSGTCTVAPGGFIDAGESFNYRPNSGTLIGSAVNLVPVGAGHSAYSIVPQFGGVGSGTPISIMAFTEKLQFTWNGNNITMVWQNNNASGTGTCPGAGCLNFAAGAGGEAGCIQSADGPTNVPTNSLCLELDGFDQLTATTSFVNTSMQLYQPFQVSYLPNTTGTDYIPMYPINKISTSPVCINNPCTQGTGSSDVWELDATYDHGPGTLKADLWDVTANPGGVTCPSSSCFEHIFTGVWIPEIVGATVAYPTVTSGSSGGSEAPTVTENVNSLVFTVNTPSSPSYTFTTYNANSTFNNGTTSIASPVYSLAPGSYTGTQSLTMSGVTTPNSYICYEVATAGTVLTQYPQTDNNGGCQPLSSGATGGLYTGTISLGTGSWDVYAMSSANNTAFNCPNGCISPTGLGPPSTIVKATYTISAGTPLTACGDLTTTGTFYLANDVTSSGGTCFWIDANNITLNLNGHTITYGGTTESLPTPGIVLADSFYTGIFQSGTTTNHNGFILTGPGTIQDAPSDATIQNAAIWAGQTAGNISPAPSIKDVTFTTNGSKANAIYATFTLSGWDIESNTINMNNNTPLSLSDRSAFLGMAIHIGDPEQAAGVIADTISNNTITAAQQGGIRTTHQNAVIDGNDITFNSKTSNDFCVDSPADGQTVHLNNCHPTSGRGLHVNASNTTLSNNTINVIELKQNAEYGTPPGTPNGCELDGTYGIQVEFDDFQGIAPTNVQISNNGITATANDCDAIGMRMTSMDTSGTVTWTSNTVTTTNSAGVGLDYGISFDADQEGGSNFSFVTNTINSMHAYVGVGYDGNASTIGAGQTWNGTHAYIVDNANGFEDFGTAAPPRPTFTQTTTLVDAVPAGATSNVLCGGVAGGTVTINGTVTTCGSTPPPQSVTISGSVKLSGGVVIQ